MWRPQRPASAVQRRITWPVLTRLISIRQRAADGDYRAQRLRDSDNPHGAICIGDNTDAFNTREITGKVHIPYQRSYWTKNSLSMAWDLDGEIICGQNEPLHTREVLHWTPR